MRILVCLSQGVGNVVMATPMVRALADAGHDVDALCVAYHGAAELLRGWDGLRDLFTETAHPALVTTGYDVACRGVWSPLRWPPIQARATDYLSPDLLDLRQHHETEANMTVARKLRFRGATPAPHVECDHPPSGLPESYTAIAPGIGGDRGVWRRKLWPHWPRLTEAMRRLDGGPVVCLGSASDRDLDVGGIDVDLRGETTLRQAAGTLAGARRVIAVDNGLAHVAAALGAETHVIFGFTSWVKNRPLGPSVRVLAAGLPCQPCQMTDAERSCPDAACIRAVRPQDVLRSINLM